MTSYGDRRARRRAAGELGDVVDDARDLAERLGLDGYPVTYWLVDHDEMNELIAYDGFPERYPHWRWGMQYDRRRKEDRYGGGKAFEIVVNDDPAHAFLQESNDVADQKAVITHVEAHADFFANNQWFGDDPDAVAMLERNARRVRSHVEDPEVDREELERFVDSVLSLTDTIDQHRPVDAPRGAVSDGDDADDAGAGPPELGVSEDVSSAVFDDELADDGAEPGGEEPTRDVLAYLLANGKQYDEETERAVEFEEWQRDVLDVVRREAYYFAPQKMTKVMNEGWAAYWESLMMGEETFAGAGEFLDYADHQAKVLGAPGLNPYDLGKQLWEHVENTANRREVLERLLRVEGVTWRNCRDAVDLDRVLERLEPPAALDGVAEASLDDLAALPEEYVDREALDRARAGDVDLERAPWKALTYEGLARRHYSLVKPQHRGFLPGADGTALERVGRYLRDDAAYESVEAALADVDFAAGWDEMYAVRRRHGDVTFVDEFFTDEFARERDYFTYEYDPERGQNRVASTDPADVKRKLLLQFTNFGKPTVVVEDGNYENRNELLLAHEYNGVDLDVEQAVETLKRTFDLWGRPVNLKTVVTEYEGGDAPGESPTATEEGRLLRYDGEEVTVRPLPWSEVEDVAASEVDYGTKPDEWLD
ncbi:MAG: SpoVR family protein [Halobacteriaceae archaeon]